MKFIKDFIFYYAVGTRFRCIKCVLRLLCTYFELLSSTTFIVSAKQNVVWLSLNLPEAHFTCESVFWLPDALADSAWT